MKKCFWDYIRVKTATLYVLCGIGLATVTIGWSILFAFNQKTRIVICASTMSLYVSSFSALIFRIMENYRHPYDYSLRMCIVPHNALQNDMQSRMELEAIVGRINEILYDFGRQTKDRQSFTAGPIVYNCTLFALYASATFIRESNNVFDCLMVLMPTAIGMLLAYFAETKSIYVVPGEIEPFEFTKVTSEEIEQSFCISTLKEANFWCRFWRYQKEHMEKSNTITTLWHVFNVVGIALLAMLTLS